MLLVCRNRRDTTLEALRALSSATSNSAILVRQVLFDDASTDGTVEAVLEQYPKTIVVRGDGTAFWNGGLYQAWREALPLQVDAFLWLNDDVVLDSDALLRLRRAWDRSSLKQPEKDFILVGSTRDAAGRVTYGGNRLQPSPFALRLPLVQPVDQAVSVDTFNGNFVLVPREVVSRIGINDPAYFHNLGDHDYGLRARQAGISVLLLEGTIGVCEANDAKKLSGFGSPNLSLSEQWKMVNTHHGLPFKSWWRFTRRHSGAWFLLHFIGPYRNLFVPRAFRKRRRTR